MDAWEATVSGPLRTRASGGKTARREPGASSDPIRSSGRPRKAAPEQKPISVHAIIAPHLSISSMLPPWMLVASSLALAVAVW